MNIRDISEVSARLEKMAMSSDWKTLTAQQKYERYEELAIAILDGEHMDYPEGVLEAYLLRFLDKKRKKSGLVP